MPKNPRRPSKAEQAQSAKEYSEQLKQYKAEVLAHKRGLALEAKQRDQELRDVIKAARKTGLYAPKSLELTPYRRKRARQIKNTFGEYINPEKHFFLPANKEAKKRILDRASQLQIQTSRTGIFFPKEFYKKARLYKDTKRDEYFIKRSGKIKKGPKAGKEYSDVTPLASMDELTSQRDRIRNMAEQLGPLKHNEAFAFEIAEVSYTGYSKQTFNGGDTENAIDALMDYINKYEKHVASFIHTLRHIRVVKTTSKTWRELHPPKEPTKRGRPRKSGGFDTSRSKG